MTAGYAQAFRRERKVAEWSSVGHTVVSAERTRGRLFLRGYAQGTDRAGEEEGAQGQVLRQADPGTHAQAEEEAEIPGQGDRSRTWGFGSEVNPRCSLAKLDGPAHMPGYILFRLPISAADTARGMHVEPFKGDHPFRLRRFEQDARPYRRGASILPTRISSSLGLRRLPPVNS